MHSRYLILTLALACALQTGCRCCRRQPASCPPAGIGGGGTLIPPTSIPTGPPPPAPVPRGAAPELAPPPGNSELLLPQNPPGTSRSQYPRVVPADPPVRAGVILGDPEAVEPTKPADKALEPLPLGPSPTAPVEGPAGIAEFVRVKDGLFAGQRPTLEGLDWLKTHGYKTVVLIRRPQDTDDTDRRQVEKRGMKFVSLLVTPEALTQQWIDQFNEIVGATANRSIFVYGQDPQAAGVVWYLHLRTAEFLTHDEARVRAGRLGLTDEKSDLFQAALKVAPAN